MISRKAALALLSMHPQPMILPPSSVLVVCSSLKCQAETVISPGLRKRIFMEWARMYKTRIQCRILTFSSSRFGMVFRLCFCSFVLSLYLSDLVRHQVKD